MEDAINPLVDGLHVVYEVGQDFDLSTDPTARGNSWLYATPDIAKRSLDGLIPVDAWQETAVDDYRWWVATALTGEAWKITQREVIRG